MAVYNAAQFLHEAVGSVLAQTFSDFELVIVDDSSTDNSPSILESFDDPRVQIIRHESNRGAALSRNHALSVARGELIAIMDADDVCASSRLSRQVAFLDANPLVGLVGCGIYDNIDATGAVLSTSYLPTDNKTIQQALLQEWCFLHPSIMFRRELLDLAGGYRKAFEPAEDHDFVLRILEHCHAHNLDERLVSYRLNPKGLSVAGHRYIRELQKTAAQLARRRRDGHPENLEAAIAHLLKLKRQRKPYRGFAGAVQKWRDSMNAADRYYGFGHRELSAGQLEKARRCFVQSLRTNGLFVKSWIGIARSWMPFAANRPSRARS
jgi:glycosyltransferase involved in cell wall biosynthesis